MNQAASNFAHFIKGLGFDVYLAKSGSYGFITDEKAERVLSFSFTDHWSLSGNYGPASRESGTGWRLAMNPGDLTNPLKVKEALYSEAPFYCGNGWKHYTTVHQHLAMYQSSSQYTKI